MATPMTEYEMEALPELEGEWEGEFEGEDEWEGEGEWEGEFEGPPRPRPRRRRGFFGRLFRGIGGALRGIARIAAPIVGTVVGGPLGGALGRVASQALREGEYEYEGEYEWEFEGEGEYEDEGEFEAAPLTAQQAQAEYMAAVAAQAQTEAEAEAMIGAATLGVLSARDRATLRRVLPHMVRGTAILTRLLRRRRITRPGVRTLPTIVRRSATILSRQAASGRPVTRRATAQVMASQTRQVLGRPRTSTAAIRRNVQTCRSVARTGGQPLRSRPRPMVG